MKIIFKILTCLTVVLITVSCSTDEINTPSSDELSIENIFKDVKQNSGMDYNYINISASNIHGNTSQINVERKMKYLLKNSSTNIMAIDQNQIDFGGGSSVAVYSKSTNNLSNFTPLFGKKITISLKSNSLAKGNAETFSQDVEVYNPAMIKATNKEELYNIDIDKGVTVEWDTDPVNDLPISIVLISRQLGSDKDTQLIKVVRDVGTFTINSSELSIFTKGSKIDVLLTRGNSETFGDTIVNLYNIELISSEAKQ